MRTNKKRQNGYTIIELLIVITVVVAIGFIGYFALTKSQAKRAPSRAPSVLINLPKDDSIHENYNTEWWYMNFDSSQSRGFIAIARAGGKNFAYIYLFPKDTKLVPTKLLLMGSLVSNSATSMNLNFSGTTIPSNGKTYLINWWQSADNQYSLDVKISGQTQNIISLVINKLKTPLYEGGTGYLDIGNNVMSYYYSYTDLKLIGKFGAQQFNDNKGWFDHQWFNKNDSNSVLHPNHEWFSIQLNNGVEIVCWRVGNTNIYMGSINSNGIQVNSTFSIKPNNYWISPSGKKYASEWSININPATNSSQPTVPKPVLIVKTQIPDQTTKSPSGQEFYEGGTTINGTYNGREVIGTGFAELTKTY